MADRPPGEIDGGAARADFSSLISAWVDLTRGCSDAYFSSRVASLASRAARRSLSAWRAAPLVLCQALLGLLQVGFRLGQKVLDELPGRARFVPDMGPAPRLQDFNVGVRQVLRDLRMIGDRADFDLPRRQGLKADPSGQELSDGALLRAEDDRFAPEQPPDQILSGEDVVPVHGVPDQLVHAVLREVVYYGCGERPATQDGLLIRRIAS